MARARRPRPKDRIEYALARGVQAVACALPAGAARELGAALGDLAFGLGVRRGVVRDNLERALGGELDAAALRSVARESYMNLGRMALEYIRFPRLTARAVESTISLTGREHLDSALERGRGAVIVAGHFGNWELFATLALMGYPVTFLVGEQHNLLVDGLMNRLRARFGVEIVPLTGSLKGVFRALRANRVVAMLSDQDAGRSGVFVEFFGRPASTPFGAARFAEASGAALLPGAVVRHPRGRHEIVLAAPIESRQVGVSKDDAIRALTQGYTSFFEDCARRYPGQYFWMHRRWKTRPEPGDG